MVSYILVKKSVKMEVHSNKVYVYLILEKLKRKKQ